MTLSAGFASWAVHPKRSRWIAPAVFAILTLAMFADVLFGPRGWIVSAAETDLVTHFVASRQFGFSEIAGGNFPLWNPRMFCGYPYFGGFQPALLYPINWLHLILPLDFAINLIIAAHFFLAGYFTHLWLRHSGLAIAASILGGVVFMCSARFFLHIYAGHLPHVCLMPWTPLLFMSIDGLTQRGRLSYALLGAWALSMMILAGYPQMVYYTAVAAPVYVIARWATSRCKVRALAGFGIIAALSLGLTAAQLLAGRDAAEESVRRRGTSYAFAASFSFPPENLLTAVAPDVLGPMQRGDGAIGYFGQAYLWEVSTFIGAGTLILAIAGVGLAGRSAALPLAMVIVTAVLGLGANTPLHRLLYDWLPGFSSFRGSSKFFFLTSLFVAQLAAIGFDRLSRRRVPWWPALAGLGIGLALLATCLWVRVSGNAGTTGSFTAMLRHIAERGMTRQDAYFDVARWSEAETIRKAAHASVRALLIAAGWSAAAGALLIASRFRPGMVYAVAALCAVEVFVVARVHRPISSMAEELPPQWKSAMDVLAPDARFVRNLSTYSYHPGHLNALDAWGYDPGVLRRYAELMHRSQEYDPDGATSALGFRAPAPAVFRLARIGLVLETKPKIEAFPLSHPLLPRAILVPSSLVRDSRDRILQDLMDPGFNPELTVRLERVPNVKPDGRRPEAVEIRQIDTDTREIKVDVPAASILLITEAYSRHWRIKPLGPKPVGQPEYEVVPADWAFIGVPLAAGGHHFRLEYDPPGWLWGRWVSLGSLITFVGATGWVIRRRIGKSTSGDLGDRPSML